MNKLNLIASAIFLFLAVPSMAQMPVPNIGQNSKTSDKPSLAQAEPKATKREAKIQCRSEGKSGKELVDCIRTRSRGE